jgi:hypothetical protein
MKTGVIYISGQYCDGEILELPELNGRKFHAITSSDKCILANCQEGLYSITSEIDVVANLELEIASAGKNFYIAADKNGVLYSWGDGTHGELGQGMCKTAVLDPLPIFYNAKASQLSCGESFTMVVDLKGNMYGWGEVQCIECISLKYLILFLFIYLEFR